MVTTGNGGSGFGSGEGARETATTTKEGSRRANYPISIRGGSDKKYRRRTLRGTAFGMSTIQKPLTRNDWRASLVPAAAVIPAPMAYVRVAAVKKLVVGRWDVGGALRPAANPRRLDGGGDRPTGARPGPRSLSFGPSPVRVAGVVAVRSLGRATRPPPVAGGDRLVRGFTLKKLGCSKRAERRPEYISMG